MPTAPSRMCPDCTKPVMLGSRHCVDHQAYNQVIDNARESDKYRRENDPLRPLYSQARWTQGTRLVVLYRDPLCCVCGNHASGVVDHHPLSAREIVAQYGIEEFYNPVRCRGLCKRCHDTKTRREGR